MKVLPNNQVKMAPDILKTDADKSQGFIFCIVTTAPHNAQISG